MESSQHVAISVSAPPPLSSLVQRVEREAILAALARNQHRLRPTAKSLGIALSTLHNKLTRLGLRPTQYKRGRPRRTERADA